MASKNGKARLTAEGVKQVRAARSRAQRILAEAREESRKKLEAEDAAKENAAKIADLEKELALRAEERRDALMRVGFTEAQVTWLNLLRDLDELRERVQHLPEGVLHEPQGEQLWEYLDHATEELIFGRPTLKHAIDTPERWHLG